MRARNIKPGFYKNADLVECSIWARHLAPGLWMMADKEGRLEDRPKQIKIEIFPCDDVNVDQLLDELAVRQHIQRYVINGKRFIQICKFRDHQRPHSNESDSLIPSTNGEISKPKDKKISTLVESASEKPKSTSSLTTDSLTTDSLIPESSSLRSEAHAREEVFVLPDWVDRKTWGDFMEIRKKLKAAQTKRAWNSIINELDRFRQNGHDPNKIIEKSIRSSWKDVFEPKENNHGKSERKSTIDIIREGTERARAAREQDSQSQAG